MIVLMKVLQVILALSILIIIHEAGHFLWARIFGIRVDKFYLFFDVAGVKLFSKKDRHYRRRCLICSQPVIISGSSYSKSQQILIIIHRLDHGTQEQKELGIFVRSIPR